MTDTPPPADAKRSVRWLGLGAALGLGLAAVGILSGGPREGELPEHAIAAVNGEVLRVEEYERAVQALASDRRSPVGEAEKRHVLDRLLEEELLVQRGLELGLVKHDRRIRGDIVSAVIQAVVSEADAEEPDEEALADFYAEQRDYFARTGRYFVRQVWVRAGTARSDAEARERAADALRRLRAEEPFEAVVADLGDREIAPVPADYLPVPKLREYLGPTATRTALELSVGAFSEPVRSASGYHVIQLVDREEGRTPPLDEIRDEVRAELRRRAGDRALRRYLDDLRDRADVRVPATLP